MIAETIESGVVGRVGATQSPAERLAAQKRKPVVSPVAGVKRFRRQRVVCAMRRHRKRLDLTLNDVFAATGVNTMQLSLYENGKVEPKVLTAIKLAAFYGVPVSDLWPVNQGA